jgi:hypothetical protein
VADAVSSSSATPDAATPDAATSDAATSDAATPLFDAVVAFLASRDLDGDRVEGERTVMRLDGTGSHGDWVLWISTDEPTQRCVVYSTAEFAVPADRRPEALELCSRINVTLAVGNFELDVDGGQIAFRTGIDVEGDRLSDALLNQLVAANIEAFDAFLPALRAVALESRSATSALAAIAS